MKKISGGIAPDPHTGEGLRRPSPDLTPLGAPALRASTPRSGPSVRPSSVPEHFPEILAPANFFSYNSSVTMREHKYKLDKKRTVSNVRATFFSERVINVWNFIPNEVDISLMLRFRLSVLFSVSIFLVLKCF